MEIKDKVWCLFEQSGAFKNEFKELGYAAVDVDIQNNFNETDYQIDLFAEIEKAYDGQQSIFDEIKPEGLIMSFFPCIFFCQASQSAFQYTHNNYQKMNLREKTEKILERSKNREYFYTLLIKLFCVVQERNLRMIVENPYSGHHYLMLTQNFVMHPTMIDHNRQLRGDYYRKPTAYWFLNCTPTYGESYTVPKERKKIKTSRGASHAGLCSEERSLMAPEYARNFICDFILGKTQENSQLTLF